MNQSASTENLSPSPPKQFVLRRVRSGMVMASLHPVAGPVYWQYLDCTGSEPDSCHYVTLNIEQAHVADDHYRSPDYFLDEILNQMVYDDHPYYFLEEEDRDEYYAWYVLDIAEKANCRPRDVVQWARTATWVEFPSPHNQIEFLQDRDGFRNYAPIWCANPNLAMQFSEEEINDDEDCEISILDAELGEFVEINRAFDGVPVLARDANKNYALLADVDLTYDRLGLKDGSDDVLFSRDHRYRAYAHAAAAGRQYVANGDNGPLSPHITSFPDLLAAFNMSCELARHWNRQHTCYSSENA